MLELGKRQNLKVAKEVTFGVYLVANDDIKGEDKVLLPVKQVPEGTKIGDELNVFLYKDSSDRLIATTAQTHLVMGEVSRLKVSQVTKIGAFLDWGLEKDLFLPFKEQTFRVSEGDECLVSLYIDKSERLCATMKIYPYLQKAEGFEADTWVEGTLYEIIDNFGGFVAVKDCYLGLIPKRELVKELKCGERVRARIVAVREDGKLDLSLREKAYLQMGADAKKVLEVLDGYDGVLPFNDRVSPEIIKREMGMSKNEFKRAVGNLLKAGKIEITEKNIRRIKE